LIAFILIVGIITGFAQIVSSFYDLREEDKKGIGAITKHGWFFYVCTIILAILPTLQKELQDSIDKENKKEFDKVQEQRHNNLKKSYDSSLLVMKGKYDTTALALTETLGKYGYKLDSTNNVLVSIRDSGKTRIIMGIDPVLKIANDQIGEGIQILEKKPDGNTKISVYIASFDAGSSFFDIKYRFALGDLYNIVYPVKGDNSEPIEYDMKLSKASGLMTYHTIPLNQNHTSIFLLVTGSYKRLDGSGPFILNDLYWYNIKTKRLLNTKGKTKEYVVGQIMKSGF
jgi:hypothetical protein